MQLVGMNQNNTFDLMYVILKLELFSLQELVFLLWKVPAIGAVDRVAFYSGAQARLL
jgi:hypothetical protein